MAPAEMLDLSRYPILSPGSEAGQALVRGCRETLRESGTCVLPGFLRPEATRHLALEAGQLAPRAHHSTVWGNAYLEPADPSLPADHPHRRQEVTSLGAVAYDLIPQEAGIRRLYQWEPLLEFTCQALGQERLYRYADPMGALNIAVMGEGDSLRWHFDQTDFVASIALQEAERGGDFEYVPMIRSAARQNYPAVARLLDGDTQGVRRLPMDPGTYVLFEGRHSIHRVTRIEGKRLRLVALLGYDQSPGVTSSDHLRLMRYGRTDPQDPMAT